MKSSKGTPKTPLEGIFLFAFLIGILERKMSVQDKKKFVGVFGFENLVSEMQMNGSVIPDWVFEGKFLSPLRFTIASGRNNDSKNNLITKARSAIVDNSSNLGVFYVLEGSTAYVMKKIL